MKRLCTVLSLIAAVVALALPAVARADRAHDGWTWDESAASTAASPNGWTWDES